MKLEVKSTRDRGFTTLGVFADTKKRINEIRPPFMKQIFFVDLLVATYEKSKENEKVS